MLIRLYRFLADLVVVAHASYIAFVVFGMAAIILGLLLRKRWARSFWFRISHLACITIVVLQAWAGVICPLTTVENLLRKAGGQPGYSGTFIGHWTRKMIFLRAPFWVFALAYTIFGALVLATFILVPPRRPGKGRGKKTGEPPAGNISRT